MKLLFTFHVRPAILIIATVVCSIIWSGCAKREREEKGTGRTERLTIIFSSDLLGRVRSCGCTVEDMGGLGRRASYTEDVRNSVRNLLVLDAGDAFGLELSYTQAEAELTFDSYELLGLDVFTPGEIDFIFGLDFLKRLAEQVTFDIVAANLVDPETNEPIFAPSYVVRELEGGTTIGITGILDDTIRFPGYIDTSRFTIISHEETLRRVLVNMKREADILILLSHMGLERSRTLAGKFTDFDLVIVGHGKPVIKKTEQVGETMLLATGGLGQYIGRVDLFVTDAGDFQVRRMRIEALEDEIPVHEGVERIFESYGVPLTEKEKK
jgi:2',3'-cyclic-nucleotide 2'-phosphodiesterase (5'-nucleotidase family)